jgi:hypothetical protein
MDFRSSGSLLPGGGRELRKASPEKMCPKMRKQTSTIFSKPGRKKVTPSEGFYVKKEPLQNLEKSKAEIK